MRRPAATFTTVAACLLAGHGASAAPVIPLGAGAVAASDLPTGAKPIPAEPPLVGPFWTWVVPVLLFLGALLATYLLYRRFADE